MEHSRTPEILKQSPYDRAPSLPEETAPDLGRVEHWVPSRYNIRTRAEDGRLIVWNTLRGSMSVFKAEQAALVESMLRQKGFESRLDGAVKYLVDRGILIKKGTHELRQFRMLHGLQQHRSDVLQLILLASEDCNFRCRYCYEEFARGTMHPGVRASIKKLVERRLPSLRNMSVEWFGGEPLYGLAAIEDLGPWLFEKTQEHGIAYTASMTTNGYLLTPEVADKLLAWNIRGFQITLDGPPECHDHSRPTREGTPSFDTIFNNLKALSRRTDDFHVRLRVNFDPNNHPHIPRLMDMVRKELSEDSRFVMHFHPVGRWGGPNDAQLEVCGAGGDPLVRQLKAAAHQRGLKVPTLRDIHLPGAQVCYAARPYNFLIGATGKVMKCTILLDKDERNVVGKILPSGELELDADKMALWTEPAFESDSQCRKCVLLPNCQGLSCPLVRMQTQRSPCVTERRHAKKSMRETLKYGEANARTRAVPMTR